MWFLGFWAETAIFGAAGADQSSRILPRLRGPTAKNQDQVLEERKSSFLQSLREGASCRLVPARRQRLVSAAATSSQPSCRVAARAAADRGSATVS